MAVELVGLAVIGQLLIKRPLLVGERMVQELVDYQHVGVMLQQPGCRAQIARGGRPVAERARILVDAQHEQRRFDGADRHALVRDALHQQGGGRPHLLAPEGPAGRQIPHGWMVIDHMAGRGLAHPAHRLHRLRVHGDHVFYPPLGQVFQAHERQQIAIIGQERFEVAVDLARQNGHGLRIEPGRS